MPRRINAGMFSLEELPKDDIFTEIICPYCKQNYFTVNWITDNNQETFVDDREVKCLNCGEVFKVSVEITISYYSMYKDGKIFKEINR